ncbi:MAG: hypothetical protein HOV83_18240, partial [Catenulispora sp.]|nr:hypothetical protein [Catenulispora sp.]
MPPEIVPIFILVAVVGIVLGVLRNRHERGLADRVGQRIGENLRVSPAPDEDPVILLEKLQRLR